MRAEWRSACRIILSALSPSSSRAKRRGGGVELSWWRLACQFMDWSFESEHFVVVNYLLDR
jgi:hypothetical protein